MRKGKVEANKAMVGGLAERAEQGLKWLSGLCAANARWSNEKPGLKGLDSPHQLALTHDE